MIATILVPLDGSDLARRAVPYARRLARATNGRLVLLRAVMVPPMPGFGDWKAQRDAEAEAWRELEQEAAALRSEGLSVDTEVGEGDAARVIHRAVERLPADLVVMATHGRSGLGRWFYGSVADRTLRLCPTPVMLVPDSCPTPRPTGNGRLRVLVPLDGSPLAEEALGPAQRLSAALDADVILLRVVDPLGKPPEAVVWLPPAPTAVALADEVRRLKAEARTYLQEIAARPALASTPTIEVVEFGEAPNVIAAVARDYGASVVVMATHGRTGLARLVLGSVASAVVQHAMTPVVLVRPSALAPGWGDGPGRAADTNGQTGPRAPIDLGPADRELLLEGLERVRAATDRGTREAAMLEELIERLEDAGNVVGVAPHD